MPLLSIETNQAVEPEVSAELLAAASARVAQLLGKPERYVMVRLAHNPLMRFAGTGGPLAYLELKSIGLPASRTAEFSAALCSLLQERLGVPADRIYIEFADAPRAMWGWDGGTF